MLGMNPLVLAGIAAVLIVLRLRNVGTLTWAIAWWLALWVGVRYGFEVPVPSSVRMLYMAIVTLSILAYVSSSTERWEGFTGPIIRLIVEPRYKLALLLVIVAVPAACIVRVLLKEFFWDKREVEWRRTTGKTNLDDLPQIQTEKGTEEPSSVKA